MFDKPTTAEHVLILPTVAHVSAGDIAPLVGGRIVSRSRREFVYGHNNHFLIVGGQIDGVGRLFAGGNEVVDYGLILFDDARND